MERGGACAGATDQNLNAGTGSDVLGLICVVMSPSIRSGFKMNLLSHPVLYGVLKWNEDVGNDTQVRGAAGHDLPVDGCSYIY